MSHPRTQQPDRARGDGLDARPRDPSHANATTGTGQSRSRPRARQYPDPADERSEEARAPRRPAGSPTELDGEGSADATERSEGAWRRGNTAQNHRTTSRGTSRAEPATVEPTPPESHENRPGSTEQSGDLALCQDPPVVQESSSSGVWTLGTTGVGAGPAACRRPQRLGIPAGDGRAGWGPGRSRCVVSAGRPQDVPGCARARPQARPHGDR